VFVGHFGLGLAAKRIVPTVSLGTLFLAVQLADALWPMRRAAWAALVLGAGVVSHWVLDVVVHGPDLPVLPRGPYMPWTFAIEGAVYAIGVTIYLRATTAKDRIGRDGPWSLVRSAVWRCGWSSPGGTGSTGTGPQ
jgi:hypothetical protein